MIHFSLFDFLFSFLEFGVMFIASNFLFRQRKNYNHIYQICIFTSLIYGGIISLISNQPVVVESVTAVALVLTNNIILYKDKIYKILSFSFLWIYLLFITDVIFSVMLFLIFHQHFENVYYADLPNRIIISSFAKAVNIILFYIICKRFKKIQLELGRREWGLLCWSSFIFLLISVLFVYLYPKIQYDLIFTLLILLAAVGLFTVSLTVLYFFAKMCQLFAERQEHFILQKNFDITKQQMMREIADTEKFEKFRHDCKKHLENARLLFASTKSEKAEEILNSLSEKANNLCIGIENPSGNKLIDAIISSRVSECKYKKIRFIYKLDVLPELNIEQIDLSSVLSNLLDNAVEAAENTSEPLIEINIFIFRRYFTVAIKNSREKSIKEVDGKLVSNKADSKLHGYGTKIISDIADKYNGNFTYTVEDNSFTAVVFMAY